MGLIELLFESAMGFAGVIGVFILLLLIGAGIFFVGSLMVLVPGVLIELFTHDKHSYKLIPCVLPWLSASWSGFSSSAGTSRSLSPVGSVSSYCSLR